MQLSMNCSTPIDYWLTMTLHDLSRWIHTNNEIRREEREKAEEK